VGNSSTCQVWKSGTLDWKQEIIVRQTGVDKMTQFDVLTLIYATLELLWEIRIKQVDMDTIDTLDQAMDKLRKIRHAALKRKIV